MSDNEEALNDLHDIVEALGVPGRDLFPLDLEAGA